MSDRLVRFPGTSVGRDRGPAGAAVGMMWSADQDRSSVQVDQDEVLQRNHY